MSRPLAAKQRRRLVSGCPGRPFVAGNVQVAATHIVPAGTWVTVVHALPENHWEAVTSDGNFFVIITKGDVA